MPEISIIMPAYNSAGTISRSICSVLDQTFTDWELIIVDDGSVDETSYVVGQFLTDSRIYSLQEKNQGVATARNTGFLFSKGKYIIFLDSDDWWDSDCLRLLHQVCAETTNPNTAAHCDWAYVSEAGIESDVITSQFDRGDELLTLILRNPFPVHAVLMPRKTLELMCGIRFQTPTIEDWELWLRLALQGVLFIHVPKKLAYYFWRIESRSKDHEIRQTERLATLNRFWSRDDIPDDIRAKYELSYASAYLDFAVSEFSIGNNLEGYLLFSKVISYVPGLLFEWGTYYRLIHLSFASITKYEFPGSERIDVNQALVLVNQIIDYLYTTGVHEEKNRSRAISAAYKAIMNSLYIEGRMKEVRCFFFSHYQVGISVVIDPENWLLISKTLFPQRILRLLRSAKKELFSRND